MKNIVTALLCFTLLLSASSCKKTLADLLNKDETEVTGHFVIPAGAHYSNESSYKTGDCTELRFAVRFDSSAVYTTKDPENQYDVNKLYGFSDNGASHHQFSARIGWRWSDQALRLFGYTYNTGRFAFEEIAAVSIGEVHECSIVVAGSSYIFTVNGKSITMPRLSEGTSASGYRLYPYFGGDEAAPHEIHIWINEK